MPMYFEKQGFIYILTNWTGSVLYIGVTSDLKGRIFQHKNKVVDGFAKKYNLDRLVYFEVFDSIEQAIFREKQLKGGSRARKLSLINERNPSWSDLYSHTHCDTDLQIETTKIFSPSLKTFGTTPAPVPLRELTAPYMGMGEIKWERN